MKVNYNIIAKLLSIVIDLKTLALFYVNLQSFKLLVVILDLFRSSETYHSHVNTFPPENIRINTNGFLSF